MWLLGIFLKDDLVYCIVSYIHFQLIHSNSLPYFLHVLHQPDIGLITSIGHSWTIRSVHTARFWYILHFQVLVPFPYSVFLR